MREYKAIDFHSHILPRMDDGSKNLEESLSMLRTMTKQGISACVATPHFYGYRESAATFLERREASWRALCEALEPDMPQLRVGAEVAAYSGLMNLRELNRLCIDGTKTLLLEMPFSAWTEQEVELVSSLCLDKKYKLVLAHLERYLFMKKRESFQRIMKLPVFVQINAEALIQHRGRREVLELFSEGQAHLLGSDCHNLSERAPNLDAGRSVLKKKLGASILRQIDETAYRLLDAEKGANSEE